jgi:hypothetical protein
MKKLIYSIALLGIATAAVVNLQSCDKIKEEVAGQIDPFSFTQQNVTITVPPLAGNDTASTSETNVPINIGQLISDNVPSGVSVGFDDVSSIKIKKITMNLVQGMAPSNNWTNFEGLFFAANTDKGLAANPQMDWQGVWTGIVDDTAFAYAPVEIVWPNPVNLKSYFNSTGTTNATYYLQGAMRRATDTLKVNANIEYEIAF